MVDGDDARARARARIQPYCYGSSFEVQFDVMPISETTEDKPPTAQTEEHDS